MYPKITRNMSLDMRCGIILDTRCWILDVGGYKFLLSTLWRGMGRGERESPDFSIC